jgi:hypothetical protein
MAKKEEQPLTSEQLAQKEAQEAQQKLIADRQQRMQAMQMQLAEGKASIALTAIHLAHLTINTFIPPQKDDDEAPTKGSRHAPRRVLTLADLDKVSAIVERLTKAAANVEPPMGPMGMRGPMGGRPML